MNLPRPVLQDIYSGGGGTGGGYGYTHEKKKLQKVEKQLQMMTDENVLLIKKVAELDINLAKLTGSPGETSWAQVHEFAPDDPENRHGCALLLRLHVAYELPEEGEDVQDIHYECPETFHQIFF